MPQQILIYDDNCPLCSGYSALFVKCGLLSKEGRKSFSNLDPLLLEKIDFNRSRHEIPLLDGATGNVLYGIDALLQLLEQKWKWIKWVAGTQPLNWLLRKCYKFISCNRKVIVAKKCGPGKIDCAPDYNYRYRYFFILFLLTVNTLLLETVYKTLQVSVPSFTISLFQFQMAHTVLVIMNWSLALTMSKHTAADYLGQVSMLALLGVLLVLPLRLFPSNPFFAVTWLAVVSVIVFREYIRRMQYAGIFETNTWIAGINLAAIAAFILFAAGGV